MANAAKNGGRVLIVEDQGIVATDIGRCLEDAGFEVTGIAASMDDAILEATRCRPDLVLMDIRIQGPADGIEAADYLHRHFHTPSVYLAAHDDPDTISRAGSTEPMAFVVKPFRPAALANTVEIALRRSATEQQALERERSLLSALDAIGDPVLTTDAKGTVRFMNRAAEELTGWQQKSSLGKKVGEVLKLVDSESCIDPFTRQTATAGPLFDSANEFQVIRHDGKIRWLTFKVTSIPAAGSNPIRVIAMEDVTLRKESDLALRRQADLLNQSQDAIFTWELDGAITLWNRGAETVYGFSAAEALGRTVNELFPSFFSSTGEQPGIALGRDGRWAGELMRRTRDGREIVIESLLIAVEDDLGRKTVLETDRDITKRRTAETEILRLNHELLARVTELTNLNKELDAFNYTISHDLRAPLRHIDAYAKLLSDEGGAGLTAGARHYLDRVRAGAARMGRMVDELLELSRTSRTEPVRQPTQLRSLVDDVISELKQEAPDRQIEWRVGDLPSVECDATLTRQVFANLLSNSLKFTRPRNEALIEVGHTYEDGEIVLFVRDNGVGFSMEYADKLFRIFERLNRREEFEGTGIGLVTVKRIIQKHGGRIRAQAEVDRGATFYFTLQSR